MTKNDIYEMGHVNMGTGCVPFYPCDPDLSPSSINPPGPTPDGSPWKLRTKWSEPDVCWLAGDFICNVVHIILKERIFQIFLIKLILNEKIIKLKYNFYIETTSISLNFAF